MGGKQAGLIGLLSAAAVSDITAVVAYDSIIEDIANKLGYPTRVSVSLLRAYEVAESDLLLSVHGREIVSDALLSRFPRGGINVHPMLEQGYKGAYSVSRAIANKEPVISVSAHRMTAEVDAGEVLCTERFRLPSTFYQQPRTPGEVYNLLYPLYAEVVVATLLTM
jgi:methionyl-tRNA formyltransferase